MTLLLLSDALILSVVLVAHVYVYRRLVRDTSRERSAWRRAGTVLAVLFPVFTIGALVTGPGGEPLQGAGVFGQPSRVLLALLVCLTGTLLVGEIMRLLWRRRTPATMDPSRRLFLSRSVAFGAIAVAFALTYGAAMADRSRTKIRGRAVEVSLPFTGRWLTENSPARRVPSHGTDLFGGSYAIDFVAVDDRHRTAPTSSWRTFLATEPPEIFHAFGRPILAPASGVVVHVHDGEPDHEARRSQLALVPYALTQGKRLREGVGAVAGNYVVMELDGGGALALAHFKRGSIRVSEGDRVTEGQHVGDCGNSGNSTQPHVHMQVMDDTDLDVARGVPMVFRRFREWPAPGREGRVRVDAIPDERSVIEPR